MYSANIERASKMLSRATKIALVGNGGNMAVAQHMASDIYRHTGKFCFAPDSVNLTALGGDNDWKEPWIEYACQSADLIIGISCRLTSPLVDALESIQYAMPTLLIAPHKHPQIETLVIPVETYHEFEVNAMWNIYMMLEQCGVDLPKLPQV